MFVHLNWKTENKETFCMHISCLLQDVLKRTCSKWGGRPKSSEQYQSVVWVGGGGVGGGAVSQQTVMTCFSKAAVVRAVSRGRDEESSMGDIICLNFVKCSPSDSRPHHPTLNKVVSWCISLKSQKEKREKMNMAKFCARSGNPQSPSTLRSLLEP